MRVRENSEQIALLEGEPAETDRLLRAASAAWSANWLLIMKRTKKLTFFTAGYAQVSTVFPYVVVSPAYFAGKMQLGGLMQTASAFNSVQNALSFFINVYRSLAEWRAVIQRPGRLRAWRLRRRAPPRIRRRRSQVDAAGDRRAIELRGPRGRLPTGAPLVTAGQRHDRRAASRVLVTGPSGSGKSTLFRAIAGIWPFGSGRVVVPKDAQRDDAAAAALFPGRDRWPRRSPIRPSAGHYDREQIAEAITRRRPARAGRSGSTRKRTGTGCCRSASSSGSASPARCCRSRIILFLDEATASLDEPAEAALYRLLQERLPERDHRLDRPPLDACGVPPPPARARPRRRRLRVREQLDARRARAAHCKRAGRITAAPCKRKRAAAPEPPPATGWECFVSLLDVGVQRQVGRQAGDEGRRRTSWRHCRC